MNNDLKTAMEFYGLGDGSGPRETVQIVAAIDETTATGIVCDVMAVNREDAPTKRCEFLWPGVKAEYMSAAFALVTIPKVYVAVFSLEAYVLEGRVLERFRELARQHNAPYLDCRPERRLERVGGVRI